MSEIAAFLHHGAEQITPEILEGIHKKLPALKLEFAEINAPKYPHLAEQLEFLAGVVEDYVEGVDDTLPLVTLSPIICRTLATPTSHRLSVPY